jgi:hypothetical protein
MTTGQPDLEAKWLAAGQPVSREDGRYLIRYIIPVDGSGSDVDIAPLMDGVMEVVSALTQYAGEAKTGILRTAKETADILRLAILEDEGSQTVLRKGAMIELVGNTVDEDGVRHPWDLSGEPSTQAAHQAVKVVNDCKLPYVRAVERRQVKGREIQRSRSGIQMLISAAPKAVDFEGMLAKQRSIT